MIFSRTDGSVLVFCWRWVSNSSTFLRSNGAVQSWARRGTPFLICSFNKAVFMLNSLMGVWKPVSSCFPRTDMREESGHVPYLLCFAAKARAAHHSRVSWKKEPHGLWVWAWCMHFDWQRAWCPSFTWLLPNTPLFFLLFFFYSLGLRIRLGCEEQIAQTSTSLHRARIEIHIFILMHAKCGNIGCGVALAVIGIDDKNISLGDCQKKLHIVLWWSTKV